MASPNSTAITLARSLSVLAFVLIISSIYLIFFAVNPIITLEPTDPPVEGTYEVYEYESLTGPTQNTVDWANQQDESSSLPASETAITKEIKHVGVINDNGSIDTFAVNYDSNRSTALTVLVMMGFIILVFNIIALVLVYDPNE